MFELIAQGDKPELRWRRTIPEDVSIELGRTTRPWSVGWDSQISRRHFSIRLTENKLLVQRLKDATNPVFYMGSESKKFTVLPGQHFVVGQTTFRLSDDQAMATMDVPSPISQKTFSPEFLRKVDYRDADRRIDVLNRLPGVIARAGNEADLLMGMVNTLMVGIPTASTIGIVRTETVGDAIKILHWDRRLLTDGDFQPSTGLIRQAIKTDETVLHIWSESRSQKRAEGVDGTANDGFTIDFENDWAFACPLASESSEAGRGWGIYVTGVNSGGSGSATGIETGAVDLEGDIKFCELVGSTLANLLQLRQLERRESSLRPFFAPIVMEAMAGRDPEEVLKPRECKLSVLFCDLRGFSKTSEAMSDNLLGLLDRVSDALGIMTGQVLELGGVIGDFHGDAAMGFWGWPLELADSAERACRAGLAIQAAMQELNQTSNHVTGDLQMGIGIATGTAVAGRIGTSDQVKVTAFGPVVNMAARLEGLNRHLQSSILLDEETARLLNANQVDGHTVRPIARVQPYGMQTSTEIHQLITAKETFDAQTLEQYAFAMKAFLAGDWSDAKAQFASLSLVDGAARFVMDYMEKHPGGKPAQWTGAIQMDSK